MRCGRLERDREIGSHAASILVGTVHSLQAKLGNLRCQQYHTVPINISDGTHEHHIWVDYCICLAQGSEREYIIVSFVRSTTEDEDVVTSVAKTAGDSVALQDAGGEWRGLAWGNAVKL